VSAPAAAYRIPDEPSFGGLSTVAVQPFWPLVAVMFGGAWLSWPWFALNGFAVGSPTRFRELALAVGGFAGSLAISIGILILAGRGTLAGSGISYAIVVLTVWKLLVSYLLYTLQSRSFHLYEHFGGTVRQGYMALALGGFFLRKTVLTAVASQVWILVMG
jgi:hypothetical protein